MEPIFSRRSFNSRAICSTIAHRPASAAKTSALARAGSITPSSSSPGSGSYRLPGVASASVRSPSAGSREAPLGPMRLNTARCRPESALSNPVGDASFIK